MPQLVINIPTPEAAQRIADAFTVLYEYDGPDMTVDKAEFVRQRIIWWLREKVREYEIRQAEQQARGTVPPDIE